MVVARIRVVSLASAAALIGALATAAGQGAAAGQSPGAGVTFTSQAAAVQLVTHYSISPAQRQSSAAAGPTAGAASDTLPALLPAARAHARAAATHGPNGVTSDNTVSGASKGTPSLSASFIGQQASNITCTYFAKGCNPPDMAIAASPQFVFQGVNTSWEVLDTAGNVQPGWPVNAQQFFGVANDTFADGTPCDTAHGSRPFLSDPRAIYDAADGRFWAAELQIAGVPALGIAGDCPLLSVMWVAVSQTSNPGGTWNVYEFNTSLDAGFFNDYTQIGINGQAIYVSANMFNIDANGNFLGFYAELFEANKAQMEDGKAHFTPDAFFNLQATGPGTTASTGPFLADTVQPAMNLDSSAGTAENFVGTFDGPDPVSGHFCSSFRDSCSGLALWTMTNPIAHDSRGGAAPALTAQYVATKPFVFPPAADQPSCSHCIDGNDLRTPGTPVVRNGILYTAWGTAANNGQQSVPAVEWAQISLNGGGATSDYYNYPGDGAAAYPALMPDAQGNVLMVFEHMSDTVFPEARYIVKASGDGNFHGTGLLLKAGEDNYRPQLCGVGGTVCRWGDYEAAGFDGAGHIWFSGEYANTLNLGAPQFGRNWGTWIGAIDAS